MTQSPPEKTTFYIVDASAYIFRSFYGMPPLTSPEGVPTNALFGFLKTLNSLIQQEKPHYLAIAFDPGGKNFRHEIYPNYKANRSAPPEELVAQFPLCRQAVDKLGIKCYEKDGFEADDVMGALARRAAEAGCDVVLVSEDKDLMQLVNQQTQMYKLAKSKWLDAKGVEETMDLTPDQIIDFLALAGDSSDNVPGVKSVGPKTATTLLKEHGSVAGIYDNIDSITRKKLKENLENCKDDAFLSLDLVTINTEVDVKFTLEDCRFGEYDTGSLQDFFKTYGLRNLPGLLNTINTHGTGDGAGGAVGATDASTDVAPSATITGAYEVCDMDAAVEAALDQLATAKEWVFDLETDSLDVPGARIVGVGFCTESKKALYIPCLSPEGQYQYDWDRLKPKLVPLFSDEKTTKIGQNLKYDIKVLHSHGVNVKGPIFDTLIASYLIDPGSRSYSIDALCETYLGVGKTSTEAIIGKGKDETTMDQVDVATVGSYACEDVDATWRLYEIFKPQLTELKLDDLYYQVEIPLVRVLADIELAGIGLDSGMLANMGEDLKVAIAGLVEDIHAQAGEEFNVNSPKQLGVILFEKMGIKPPKKTKTGYSTNVDVLQQLSFHHELPRLVLEYRQFAKLKSTYVDALPKMINAQTNRIHTSFVQVGTETGRLSSRDPNLQNIPIRSELGRSIRRAFVPSEGDKVLIAADYSQIELRILAHMCQDPFLVKAFADDQDIHRMVAAEMYEVDADAVTDEMRANAKAINFGIIYGKTPYGLSQDTGMTVGDAKSFIDAYFERFSGVSTFIDSTIEKARQDGQVKTMLGRFRVLHDINSDRKQLRQFNERMAVNTTIQGSAADLIKKAMVDFHQAMTNGTTQATMLLQIHDELVFETPRADVAADMTIIQSTMESAMDLTVPLKVSIDQGDNWMDVK